MEMANSSKMRERRKIEIFMGKGESLGCKQERFVELIMVPKDAPYQGDKGPWNSCKEMEKVGMCVCEELALQASIKAWGGAQLKNEHTSLIFTHNDISL